jgi:hypothetical protein
MTKARDLADLGNKTSLDEINDAYDAGALSNRNLIINGAMNVAQRGTSFSGTSGGAESHFATDRWRYGHKTGTVTITQNGVSDLAGFQNSVKIQVTGTGTAATGDQDLLETKIEGQDLQRAGWGQTGAKDLILSFYYKSNSTDNRVAWFYNPQRGRDFAVIFASSAVNTWERITINIPADQAFNDSNGAGLYIRVVLSSGSQFTTGLASTWSAIGNDRYAGVANFHSSTSNYVEFTGVQLEVGDTATPTPFEHRSYGDELAKCQRYYYKHIDGDTSQVGLGDHWSTTQLDVGFSFPVTMRATPTLIQSGGSDHFESYGGGGEVRRPTGNWQHWRPTVTRAALYATSNSNVTAGKATRVISIHSDAFLGFDAEL